MKVTKPLLSVDINQVSYLLVLHWGCLSFHKMFNVLFETGNSSVTVTFSMLYGFFQFTSKGNP